MSDASAKDWTEGGAALCYQHCPMCHATWYFRRPFCPRCGAGEPEHRVASGRGRIHAVIDVARAPTAAFRPHAPYRAALVDAEEGFRFLAHAEAGLAIGDGIETGTREVAGGPVPYVRRAP